jgi:antitoxin component YwqK of YwqJK toxin-antitoxin module
MSYHKENIFPKEINALIATYLEDEEGKYFRDKTNKFFIKDIINGNTYKNGLLHSFNDMPAVIESDGTKKWYKNGKIHRDNDLPAVIYSDVLIKGGEQFWYQNGKIHRDNDMPAVISNVSQMWYKNGELHRDDNDNDNYSVLVFNLFGKVICQEWWNNGTFYKCQEWRN